MVCTYLPLWPSLDERSTRRCHDDTRHCDRSHLREAAKLSALVVKGSRIERHSPDGGVNISRANIITIGVSVLGYSNVGIRVFHSWCSSIRIFDYLGAGIWESRRPTTGLCYHRVRHLRSGWSTVPLYTQVAANAHAGKTPRKVPLLPVLEQKGEHSIANGRLLRKAKSRGQPVLASRPPEQSGKQKAAPSAQPEWRCRNIQDLSQLKPEPIALRRDRCGLISRLKLLSGPK